MNLVSQFTFCKLFSNAIRKMALATTRHLQILNTLTRASGSFALTLALAACSSYELRVNDNIVYSPLPLLSDFQIPDEALNQCIQKIIEQQQIYHKSDLTVVICPQQNIQTLEGLEGFEHIAELRLPDNQIQDIKTLSTLYSLREVDLSGNSLEDAASLATLPALKVIDISNNDKLRCDSIAPLKARKKLTLSLPAQCS